MKALILILVILSSLGFSLVVGAEEHSTSSGAGKGDPKAGAAKGDEAKTERPAQEPTALKPQETNLLSSIFRIPTGVVNDLFGGKVRERSIPAGVDAALAGDETKLARIVADLYGTLNRKQADVALSVVEQQRTDELAKNPRDGRFLALLDRLFWGGKILDGEPSNQEGSQKYNDAFNAAFKERQDRTGVIQEKVKEALAGNNQAKDFLRNNLNRRTLMAFLDAQRKSGNTQLANDLLQAIAFGGDNGKEKFIDLFNGKETHRLNLGFTKESMEKALAAYSDARGGLHSTTLAGKPFIAPTRTFTLRNDGQLAANGPQAQPTADTGAPKTAAAQPKQRTPQRPQQPVDGGKQTTATSGPPTGGAQGAGFAAFISRNCVGCHSQDPEGTADGRVRKGAQTYTIQQVIAAMGRVPAMRNGVSAEVKSQLQAFSR